MSNKVTTVLRVNMAGASDVGTVRNENEDSYYYSEAKRFFVTCDGMGGHEKGAAASQMACETLRDLLFAGGAAQYLEIHGKRFDVGSYLRPKSRIAGNRSAPDRRCAPG